MRTVLLTLIIISLNFTLQFAQPLTFKYLTTEHGLSNNVVYDLIQDKTGFFWFATEDGLNRYDGYSFKTFRYDPSNENSISDNSIWTLKEDSKGNIWIGTRNGWLNCYDPVKNIFRKWRIRSEQLETNAITFLMQDRKNNIWIGTYRGGLYRFDMLTEKIEHWYHSPGDNNSLSNNYVSSILEDKNGNIWISTYNGLNKFIPGTSENKFERYFSDKKSPNSITDNIVWYLTQSALNADVIWIGTANGLSSYNLSLNKFSRYEIPNKQNLQFGTGAGSVIEEIVAGDTVLWIDSYAGLLKMNHTRKTFERYTSQKAKDGSISSNQIHRMFKDRSGTLWLASLNGINYSSVHNLKFNSVTRENRLIINTSALKGSNIKTVINGPGEKIWCGTDDGLYYSEFKQGQILFKKHFQSDGLNIWSLTSDTQNNMWIGTYGNGLFKLDFKTNLLTKINPNETSLISPAHQFNKVVYADYDSSIWIGYWGVGLAHYSPKNKSYKNWLKNSDMPSGISHDDVWSIYRDIKGRLWIGTNGGGLNLFDEVNEKFYQFNGDVSAINNNCIFDIVESTLKQQKKNTTQTILWVGTDNGLYRIEFDNSKNIQELINSVFIKNYSIKDGLSDNSIKSIEKDSNGNLWLGTSSGISLFNVSKEEFKNFNKADGILDGDINPSASITTTDDIIFMGSSSGMNYFYPDGIKLSSSNPPLVITDFQIFNLSVYPGENSVLKSSILFTDEVELSYSQNVFSIEFAALDYISPNSVLYAYKMDGFDKDWILCGTRRFVTYTNLNPGQYRFHVKSTNRDGVWNENSTQLRIIIIPPWWQTGWAISLYVLVIVLGIWGIVKFQSYRTRLQHELKLQEFEAHHLREIESMKSRFFANLSHEFRTPLTMIKGPLEQLINGRIKENLLHYYKIILNNTEKLQALIEQLLELSRLDVESIPVNKHSYELIGLLKSFTYSFIPLAEQKFITLTFESNVEKLNLLIDRDKLEKIINNLLSNAFKFTPDGGKIHVNIIFENTTDNSHVIVEVVDNGIGIPEQYRTKIFDRFYQVETSYQKSSGGSGIGLALVKELVNLLSWNISVMSKENEGTKFILKIPVETINQTLAEQDVDNLLQRIAAQNLKPVSEEQSEISIEESGTDKNKPTVLIVEDSTDTRNFISDLLQHDYTILSSPTADEGIEYAFKNMPDLIVSDLMMPGMDGLEFCRRIKTDWRTSHIPVILLTAKATDESKLEGLETGADDYILKPFRFEELAVRIKNLIEQRKHLHEKFSKDINLQPKIISGNSIDEEFLNRVIDTTQKNIGNNNFTSEKLAEELFVSKRQLHRKLLAITGQGPGEFIRIMRLKKAAQMLLEKKLSVTQIAYEVGFESPAQFSRAFKKQFDSLPSDFHKYDSRNDLKHGV